MLESQRERAGATGGLAGDQRESRTELHWRPTTRRLYCAACLVGQVLVGAAAASLDAQNPADARDTSVADSNATRAIGGTLTDARDGEPMPFATIMLVGTNRESFADGQGHFRFTRLPSGTYHIRARQIGYAPVDTTIRLAIDASPVDVVLRMQPIPLRLPTVAVRGSRSRGCVVTGVPDSASDPALAAVFTQVRENADRLRILVDEYPFRYRRQETVILRTEPGGDSIVSVDTAEYVSTARRPYRVGGVVYIEESPSGQSERVMYLPTFRDLADSTFLATHCFRYAGKEALGPRRTQPALRIDFRPADSIHAPDVGGSIYLDSASLVIRRAVFRLQNAQSLHLSLLGLTVTTTYRQVVTLVPVIDSMVTDEPLVPVNRVARTEGLEGDNVRAIERTQIENAYLLSYEFEGRRLGEVDRDPGAIGATRSRLPNPAQLDTALTPTVVGRVMDSSGQGVAGALAALIGTDDSALSDDQGRFTLRAPQFGAYVIGVRRLGFRPERLVTTLSPERTSDITVSLTRTVPRLPTVTTTAE